MRQHREPELMDDPALDTGKHRHALHSLRRINRWLGVDRRLVRTVRGLIDRDDASFLDIGTGCGGWLAAANETARREGCSWRLYGMDCSVLALRVARSIPGGNLASMLAGDALAPPLRTNAVDVAVCSLLLHHFDPEDVVELLREASRIARRAVVIGDLDRGRLAWTLTWLATRLTSRSTVFHVDGPRSVRAAYRPAEMQALAEQAGMLGATIKTVFPNRWILSWTKNA